MNHIENAFSSILRPQYLKNPVEDHVFTYIKKGIKNIEQPKRVALSSRFPSLKKPILFIRRAIKTLQNFLNPNLTKLKGDTFFESVVARHQSLLMRKLGDSDPRLQQQKITNLKHAAQKLNGVIIPPGKTFSLWNLVGNPSEKNGYVNGMLLSNGKVVEGIGGGLCQMSNLLFWLLLHAPTEIVERYHHSMDVFPDSGRVLPFGSGATILYNFVDLKMKNVSNQPLQLKIWVTDKHLKGQVRAAERIPSKFHLFQKEHFFVKKGHKYYRYNQIWREEKIKGESINSEKIATNLAPVLYDVDTDYLERNNYQLYELA